MWSWLRILQAAHEPSAATQTERLLRMHVQGHKPSDPDARDEQELFGAAGGGKTLGDEFGLQLQDDDEGAGGFDDDEEDEDMVAEEGEV